MATDRHMLRNLVATPQHLCLYNRSLVRRDLLTNGSQLMEGYICSILKGDKTEEECLAEDAQNKDFFVDKKVRRRLRMLTPSKDYFVNIATMAFKPLTQEERETPLAFSIMCHSNLGIFEALLASIFRPHNFYCVYVDNKADEEFVKDVKRIINAYSIRFKESNIFLAAEPRMNIYWGSVALLEAPLSCMDQLLALDPGTEGPWKFFLNTVGTALPMITVQELAKLLHDLPEGSDVIMSETMPDEKESLQTHKFKMMNDSVLEAPNKNLEGENGSYLRSDVPQRTNLIKERPAYNIMPRWGWTESIVSRKTAKFLLSHPVAQEFRTWVQDIFFPEEFFYATMATIDQDELKRGRIVQDLKKDTSHGICVRKSLWVPYKCKGKVKRDICNLGLGDLPAMFQSGCLFANKFDLMATDSRVVKCMHEYLTR